MKIYQSALIRQSASGEADGYRFALMGPGVNRNGLDVDPRGMDLTSARQHLPLLWQHDDAARPLGRMVDLEVTDDAIYGTAVFSRVNPFAAEIKADVDEGDVRYGSMGYVINEWRFLDDDAQERYDEGRMDWYDVMDAPKLVTSADLLEYYW